MADKKVSDLPEATELFDADLFETSDDNGSPYDSKGVRADTVKAYLKRVPVQDEYHDYEIIDFGELVRLLPEGESSSSSSSSTSQSSSSSSSSESVSSSSSSS